MATSRSFARFRIREDQAKILHRLVWQERGRMTRERARWRGSFPTTTFNQIIAILDITKREIEQIAEEEDWTLGEPWATDPEEPGPGVPDGEQEPVGERPRDLQ